MSRARQGEEEEGEKQGARRWSVARPESPKPLAPDLKASHREGQGSSTSGSSGSSGGSEDGRPTSAGGVSRRQAFAASSGRPRRSSVSSSVTLPLAIRTDFPPQEVDTPPSSDRSGSSSSPRPPQTPPSPSARARLFGLFTNSGGKKRKASTKTEPETTALNLTAVGVSGALPVTEREWRIACEVWESFLSSPDQEKSGVCLSAGDDAAKFSILGLKIKNNDIEKWDGFYIETDLMQMATTKTSHNLIGEGGESRVIRAFRIKTGEYVAIKIFKAGAPHDAMANEETATQLLKYFIARIDFLIPNHPQCLVTLASDQIQLVAPVNLSSGKVKGHPDFERYQMIVEVFLGPMNLFHILYKQVNDQLIKNRYSPDEELELIRQLFLTGAAFLKLGLVHRDLKPENIIWGNQSLKFCDYAGTRLAAELTGFEPVAGTFGYVAPEAGKGMMGDFTGLDKWPLAVIAFEIRSKPILDPEEEGKPKPTVKSFFKEKLKKKAEEIKAKEGDRELTRDEVFLLMRDVVVKKKKGEEQTEFMVAFRKALENFKTSLDSTLMRSEKEKQIEIFIEDFVSDYFIAADFYEAVFPLMALNPDERGDLEEAALKMKVLQQKYLRYVKPLKDAFIAEKSIREAKISRDTILMVAQELGRLLPEEEQLELKLPVVPRAFVHFPPLPSPPPSPSPSPSTSSSPPPTPTISPAYSLNKGSH